MTFQLLERLLETNLLNLFIVFVLLDRFVLKVAFNSLLTQRSNKIENYYTNLKSRYCDGMYRSQIAMESWMYAYLEHSSINEECELLFPVLEETLEEIWRPFFVEQKIQQKTVSITSSYARRHFLKKRQIPASLASDFTKKLLETTQLKLQRNLSVQNRNHRKLLQSRIYRMGQP